MSRQSKLIKSIYNHETVFALHKLCKYLVDTGWHQEASSTDEEVDAEYNLAVVKSKRYRKDIEELANADIELEWGQTRKFEGGYSVIYGGGDFNPWYRGELTIEQLLDSTSELAEYAAFLSGSDVEAIEFAHYHFYLEKETAKSVPKVVKKDVVIDLKSLHPKILNASRTLYKTNHFAPAILEAYKVIFNEIKDITEIHDLDGKRLVERAFSGTKPLVQLNKLTTESDKDEQLGFMLLLSGAALGIRNPKAHDLVVQLDKYRTLEYLSYASLLLSRIDERHSINVPAE